MLSSFPAAHPLPLPLPPHCLIVASERVAAHKPYAYLMDTLCLALENANWQ